MGKSREGICAYCGKRRVVTEDHVISHGLFPKGFNHQQPLPKTPACQPCNSAYSKDEGYFRAALMAPCKAGSAARDQVYKTAARTLDKDAKIAKQFKSEVFKYIGRGEDGNPVVKTGHEPDHRRMQPIFTKFCKGLYFHESKQLAPVAARALRVVRYTELIEPGSAEDRAFEIFKSVKRQPLQKIAFEGESWAEWTRAPFPNDDGRGIWFFQVHDGPSWLVFFETPLPAPNQVAKAQRRKQKRKQQRASRQRNRR